ncbi:MAG TPA: cation diffusion facilitator family transporter [Phenylobacterium sp.]|uniref:cation diffusion facilitator family transporter n=1 Tax=Phenylobacterium sp. TaxID=1871053 RepID=UPI002B46099A|nr:cation diffusion facilitator family transporter [Phenylobacterium sp.]HKR89138.1 cation diffusion facilitator family transporter [Phenylobacterium sp.]
MQKGRDKTSNGPDVGGARKVVLAALAGNLAIAATKFAAFAFTASTAMLTEGIHSLVDTGDQLLLLMGQKRAARPPNDSHPFGYGMETYFWSFIVALMVFLAGGAVSIWEGVERMLHPQPVTLPLVSFGVLAASALFDGLTFRIAYREYRHIVRGRDVRLVSFLRHSKDPNVFATLMEDGAAMIGLAMAAAGVAGSTLLGWAWADGAASVLIGVLLVAVAAFLANETRSLIAGEAATPIIKDCVRQALGRAAHLGEPLRLRTLHLGPRTILVTVAWRFKDQPSYAAAMDGLAQITADIRSADARVCDVLFEFPEHSAPAPQRADKTASSAPRSSADDTAPPDRRARPRGPPG